MWAPILILLVVLRVGRTSSGLGFGSRLARFAGGGPSRSAVAEAGASDTGAGGGGEGGADESRDEVAERVRLRAGPLVEGASKLGGDWGASDMYARGRADKTTKRWIGLIDG